ncbi:Hypothetical_protein [Hexamita inflata]|uniref:Hypothetical_protein n=1 Tax=Hexamita inflata TaxID=28002 RepID=A0AA86RHB8_9EUKA|nr:Hypothetical protein HINF_LOCUS62428 [Hexamita inflata]
MNTPTIPKSPAELQLTILNKKLEQTTNENARLNSQLKQEREQTEALRTENTELYEQFQAQITAMPSVSAEELEALKLQNASFQAQLQEQTAKTKEMEEQALQKMQFEAQIMQILGVAERAKVIDRIELISKQNALLQQLVPKKEEMERIWAVQNQLGKLIQVKEKPTEHDRAKFIQTLRKELKTCYRIECATEEEVIIEAQKKGTDQFWKNMDIEMTNSRKYFDKIVNAAKGESK